MPHEVNFTKIPNDILEALTRINLSAYQSRIMLVICQKTFGYQKESDRIPISQFVKWTGIKKGHVCRTLKELKLRNIVTQPGNKLPINPVVIEWSKLPNGVTPYRKLPNGVTSVTQPGKIKRNYSKEKYFLFRFR